MRRRSRLLAVAVALAAMCVTPGARAARRTAPRAGAPQPDIKHWTLPNGLEVLHLHDGRAPVVAVEVFYHVGSKDETVGQRGIAHMFEHMMFKGSKHLRAEDHARYLDRVGGTVNAFTSQDVTGYHDTVPRDQLRFALRLEAERMRNLLLTPSTVASEREVVKEEKRLRIDSNPIARTSEKLYELAFTRHPYAWTAAGRLDELDRVTPAACQAFYDRYYRPDNATLIVVGDVGEAEVRAAVEETFGAVPRGAGAVPRVSAVEPPQSAMRDETVEWSARLPVILGGYHMPEAASPDTAPLEVLSAILSGGESSRVHRRLVRDEKLALFAGGFAQPREQPGLFVLFAAHLPGIDQAKLKAALLAEIDAVRERGVEAAELEKAKNQLTVGLVRRLEDVTGIATVLGNAQYVEGGWRHFLDARERFLRVSAADVQRVARRWLGRESLTMLTLRPVAATAPAAGPRPSTPKPPAPPPPASRATSGAPAAVPPATTAPAAHGAGPSATPAGAKGGGR